MKKSFTMRMDVEVLAALAELRRRDGVPASVAVTRAVTAYMKAKKIPVKATAKGGK